MQCVSRGETRYVCWIHVPTYICCVRLRTARTTAQKPGREIWRSRTTNIKFIFSYSHCPLLIISLMYLSFFSFSSLLLLHSNLCSIAIHVFEQVCWVCFVRLPRQFVSSSKLISFHISLARLCEILEKICTGERRREKMKMGNSFEMDFFLYWNDVKSARRKRARKESGKEISLDEWLRIDDKRNSMSEWEAKT